MSSLRCVFSSGCRPPGWKTAVMALELKVVSDAVSMFHGGPSQHPLSFSKLVEIRMHTQQSGRLYTSQEGYTTFCRSPPPINLAPLRHNPCAAAPLLHHSTRRAMELYLIPNDPVNTTFISSDGFLRYWVRTNRPLSSLRACSSIIQRPAADATNDQETLGEITWGGLGRHSVIHSDLFRGRAEVAGGKAVKVRDLLWKINTFGTSVAPISSVKTVY